VGWVLGRPGRDLGDSFPDVGKTEVEDIALMRWMAPPRRPAGQECLHRETANTPHALAEVPKDHWDVPDYVIEDIGMRAKGSPTHAIRRCVRTEFPLEPVPWTPT